MPNCLLNEKVKDLNIKECGIEYFQLSDLACFVKLMTECVVGVGRLSGVETSGVLGIKLVTATNLSYTSLS